MSSILFCEKEETMYKRTDRYACICTLSSAERYEKGTGVWILGV